ncbi:hypothetical protein LCGC14_0425830 [marine sediment metagenome]|uniref:Uncharacterized protein n=1 Tax=marine sediment metagenome TaxID=412755 RepID=A0A0F9VBQ6_9ZZZZ
MANTNTVLIPKILARALSVLRQRVIMPRLVNGDYSADAVKKGTQIEIPIPVAVADQDVAPSNVLLAPTDVTPTSVILPVDQHRHSAPIGLTDKEKTEIEFKDNFLPSQMEESIKGLANRLNQFIWGKFTTTTSGIYGFISNPSAGTGVIVDPFATGTTDTSGVSAATGAKKVLNEQLCPRTDRRGVLSFNAEAAMLDLAEISDAEKIGSSDVKITGEVGRKFGIDWFADDDIPTHTVGTSYEASVGDVTCRESDAVGVTAISILDAGAGTLVAGDIFTIAGDTQTYCVTGSGAPYTLHASNDTQVSIVPALKVAVSGEEVVTVKNSHTVNLVFHRDAIALVMRVMEMDIEGRQVFSATDPVSGITLRLIVTPQHYQTTWSFDILYGCTLVRPEFAVRIAGAI